MSRDRLPPLAKLAGVTLTFGAEGEIEIVDGESGDSLRFVVESDVFDAWIAGRANFDDVLGSGAFRLWRSPEHFNRDLFARLRRHL